MTAPEPLPSKIACMVSVPKCASHSIREMLQLGRNRDDDAAEPNECHVIYENHQRLAVLERKYDLAGKFVFAFVRNPHERLASWFHYHAELEPYASRSFGQWLRDGCPTHWTVQNGTDWARSGLSPLLQCNFLDGDRRPDFVGRMEDFAADMQRVIAELNAHCERAGFARRFAYQELRMNRSRPYAAEYTPELRRIAYEQFERDFEAFGYPR